MKVKPGYMLREIAGHFVVLPLGARVVEFNGIITLNDTGAFLWKNMSEDTTEAELTEKLTTEYNIDAKMAKEDIKEFVDILKEKKILDQE